MYVGVPGECAPRERRVALTPEGVAVLVALGHRVGVASGAGAGAGCPDAAYAAAGAELVPPAADLLERADLVVKVRPPSEAPQRHGVAEVDRLRPGALLVGMLDPLRSPDLVAALARRRVAAFSLDQLPRIARAQSMDALSSMSTVAGYRAAVSGAALSGRFFPLLMTAAGTEIPARVLVVGAGVAGLQAIATARRLGAVVQALDTRPAARQQVESLGATCLDVPIPDPTGQGGYAAPLPEDAQATERAVLAAAVRQADLVITTAQVPGRPAPLLITREMVASMHAGAVLIDLAAETGGNCAATVAGQVTTVGGVIVDGACGPWDMPYTASRLYSRNVTAFLRHLFGAGLALEGASARWAQPDPSDPIVGQTCLIWDGRVVHPGVAEQLAGRGAHGHPAA